MVAGIRTPEPIVHLKDELPEIYAEFRRAAELLEEHYRELQDIEFTVQEGKLYILQTRSGKRTAAAAVKVAVDLVREGKISKEEALLRVDPTSWYNLCIGGLILTLRLKCWPPAYRPLPERLLEKWFYGR